MAAPPVAVRAHAGQTGPRRRDATGALRVVARRVNLVVRRGFIVLQAAGFH
jgi:hypothetical protein